MEPADIIWLCITFRFHWHWSILITQSRPVCRYRGFWILATEFQLASEVSRRNVKVFATFRSVTFAIHLLPLTMSIITSSHMVYIMQFLYNNYFFTLGRNCILFDRRENWKWQCLWLSYSSNDWNVFLHISEEIIKRQEVFSHCPEHKS